MMQSDNRGLTKYSQSIPSQATEIGGSHYQHGMQFGAVASTQLY